MKENWIIRKVLKSLDLRQFLTYRNEAGIIGVGIFWKITDCSVNWSKTVYKYVQKLERLLNFRITNLKCNDNISIIRCEISKITN